MTRAGLHQIVLWLAGATLLFLPFIPYRDLVPTAQPDLAVQYGARDWLLGCGITLALAWLIAYLPKALLARLTPSACVLERLAKFAPAVFVVLTLLALFCVFAGKPHLIDTIVQLFQAKMFAAGEISAPAPAFPGFFSSQHMLFDQGRWYSQYAPLHSAILAFGYLVSAPWLPCLILALAAVFLLRRFCLNAFGSRCAAQSVIMYCLAPFVVFMSASYMNHITSLFLAALFLYAWERYSFEANARAAALVGVALGLGFSTRSLDFIALGFPFLFFEWRSLLAPRSRVYVLVLGVFGVLGCLPYFIYNKLTTGEFLLPGFIKLWGESHALGFHQDPWGEMHTPLRGILNQLISINQLNEFLFELPFPILSLLGLALVLGFGAHAWERKLLAAFYSVPVLYIFYWHRDSFLGPRYLYVALPFLFPLLARSIDFLFERLRTIKLGRSGILKPVDAPTLLRALLIIGPLYALLVGIPLRTRLYASSMPSMRVDLADEARAQGIEAGVIFVATSFGGRIISNLRELGVPAYLVETAYRSVDHCELHGIAAEAFARNEHGQKVAEKIIQRIEAKETVHKVRLNQDPTLRLNLSRPLTPECQDELKYDQAPYTSLEPHLLENSPNLNGSLVVARDLRNRNTVLRSQFQNLPAYRYRPGGFERLW